MIRQLQKKRHSSRGGGIKYYINCSSYAKNKDKIKLDTVIYNKTHVAIIQAVAQDENYKKKNKNVVVKIGKTNSDTLHEYEIGEKLFSKKIQGFIKYICLFSCYDDTSLQIKKDATNIPELCNAEHIPRNKKDVLVMPFFKDGSIEKYNWTEDKMYILQNLVLQTVLAFTSAYETLGFLHNDPHLGNLLINETKRKELVYELPLTGEIVTEPIFGYKVVIMDFEKSKIGIYGASEYERSKGLYLRNDSVVNIDDDNIDNENLRFWDNIYKVCVKIDTDLHTDTYMVRWENNDAISYARNASTNHFPSSNIIEFIDILLRTKINITPTKKHKYTGK